MTLRPCSQCRRHVAATEAACPFCGALLAAAPPPPSLLAGRWSRAAVFAGAAVAGCYTSNPPPPYPPPPPPDEQRQQQQQQQQQVEQQQFAQPPVATGSISGVVTESGTTRPVPSLIVRLQGENVSSSTRTDAAGRYSFDKLPAGEFTLTFGVQNHPRRPPPPSRKVSVVAGAAAQADFAVIVPAPEPYNPNQQAKPYGAPPARYRVV